MSIFVVSVNGIPKDEAFTSLSAACKLAGVSYNSAARGKTVWQQGENLVRISRCNLVRISGRGGNSKFK